MAACLAASAALLALGDGPDARAGDFAPLPPDLVTRTISSSQLDLHQGPEKLWLRLDNTVANRGLGPLEIVSGEPGAAGCGSDEHVAQQRLYEDTNSNERFDSGGVDGVSVAGAFGCMRYHPKQGHEHWHVIDFTVYRLFSERTGKRVAIERKQGFCLFDGSAAYPGMRDFNPLPEYGFDDCQFGDPVLGEGESIREGLSIGWSDVYRKDLPGQSIDVTGLRAGRYCLTSTADPLNLLAESSDDNNSRRSRIQIRPVRRAVTKLPGSCRSNPPDPVSGRASPRLGP